MKRNTHRKVHRNFKLTRSLNAALIKEANRMKRTQTMVVEMALASFLAIKH